MKIQETLSPDVVKIGLRGNTKEEIINELLDLLVAHGTVLDRDLAYRDIWARERQMSTGIEHGIAIPHAKTKAVNSLTACIGIKPEGMDFQSLDGQPSTIFILTLSSVDQVGPHVRFLSEISQVLHSSAERKALLAATTGEEVLSVFGIDE